jgi:hypothetical protein
MSSYRTIPDAALDAAHNAYDYARGTGPTPVSDMLADVVTAALPHLVTDEAIERAARALGSHGDDGFAHLEEAARAALTAALGSTDER